MVPEPLVMCCLPGDADLQGVAVSASMQPDGDLSQSGNYPVKPQTLDKNKVA
ncbi:hypothetical protein J3369_07475 [Alteromonas sp. NFXS44]|uniref:hypothetical protein n=1 Tax=Alteromonas sp. NFXS44 TaxID=2818435 RepID=UPI002EB89840|nr:hypothetical protein [Pseudomonadota bacterium]